MQNKGRLERKIRVSCCKRRKSHERKKISSWYVL